MAARSLAEEGNLFLPEGVVNPTDFTFIVATESLVGPTMEAFFAVLVLAAVMSTTDRLLLTIERTLCHLGDLNGDARARWLKSIEVFNEHGESRQLKLFPADVELPKNDSDVAQVILNKVRLERTRQFGSCFLGLQLRKKLGLDKLFKGLLDHETADIPWSRVVALLALNRLCAPGSELAIEQRWFP